MKNMKNRKIKLKLLKQKIPVIGIFFPIKLINLN